MTIMLTPEARRSIDFMSTRFFVVQPDGTLRMRNDYGKLADFAFQQKEAAVRCAGRYRNGAQVWDKLLGRFI